MLHGKEKASECGACGGWGWGLQVKQASSPAKLVYKQLINYIEKHDIPFQFQFGFRKGHSTAQAVSEIADNLREAIDNNLIIYLWMEYL